MSVSPDAISLAEVSRLGSGLVRPECVACRADGTVFTSHFGGGVSRIDTHGRVDHVLGAGAPTVATNGFALTPDGAFLCASLLPPGGVWRVGRGGDQVAILTEVDGMDLVSVNFVHLDPDGRLWVAVSTRRAPRDLGYRPDVDDGFIVLADEHGARIVADGLGYTNETKVSPDGRWLYVNETFGRRTSRFALGADRVLGTRETVTEYGHGVFPDGLEFDAQGGVWITSIVSNRVIRVAPDGTQQVVLEDFDADALERVERAYLAGELGRSHLDSIASSRLRSVSSIAFGGPDLRTVHLGNLLDDCLYTFRSPIAGAPPPHWRHTS